MFGTAIIRKYKCNNCDLTFLWPQMNSEEEKKFYKNYNKKIKKRLQEINTKENDYYKKSKLNAKKRYKYIKKYFEDINSVCEIGASIGSFLELLNEDIIKCAVEPNDINRNEANNFSDYQYEYVDDIPENLCFDIICMFHTFDHIKKPISFLETCKNH